MKTIEIHNRCSDFSSYRAARVKSMFNAENGCNFDISVELPLDEKGWSLGVIVGPSGSGKTSIGKKLWPKVKICNFNSGWDKNKPIIDCIAPEGDFNAVTGALAAVGLGNVPAWLRPYHILSNGEKFRAALARIIAEPPGLVVIDEFSSVVDRQIAKFGALAFAKSWRREAKKATRQCVLLSCHYDILEWLEPDWIFDTATGKYSGRCLRRPKFELQIYKTNWSYWRYFEPHHYLKVSNMIAAKCYVGTVSGELVCHLGVSSKNKGKGVEARACRLVVMPEWQGAGVGMRFLNQICQWNLEGADGARFPGRPVTTLFHSSHPGLCAALRRDTKWRQLSAHLYGQSKKRSHKSLKKSNNLGGKGITAGYGGHFRAVQGFRYIGNREK